MAKTLADAQDSVEGFISEAKRCAREGIGIRCDIDNISCNIVGLRIGLPS